MLKRIVTIQDISCFGKCSLTVALPVISAMGVETAVIPTAVLSTHTTGFTGYTFRDLTADIPQIAAHWKNMGLTFDGIYTGYLGSREQVQIVSDFFDAFRGSETKIVVDPVMGDAGKLYAGFTPDFAGEMRKLCQKADVIVPNLTEVSLLLDIPYPEQYTEAQIRSYLKQLTQLGCPMAVITGVRYNKTQHGAAAYDSRTDSYYTVFREHVPEQMHGTGTSSPVCCPVLWYGVPTWNRRCPLPLTLPQIPLQSQCRICIFIRRVRGRGTGCSLNPVSAS